MNEPDELYIEKSDWLAIGPEPSGWRCELFGTGQSMVLTPEKGRVPNWFWRWMQYLILGNRWIKEK